MTIRFGPIALPLAALICACAPTASSGLAIAGVVFAPSDIAEATTGDDGYGSATVRIRFTPEGAARFHALQKGRIGQPLPITVDEQTVSTPILAELIEGDDVTINGNMTAADAAALAARIAPSSAPTSATAPAPVPAPENPGH